MICSIKIVNSIGESISMDIRKPEVTGFLISSVEGLTFPKAELSSNEIAMFDGATITNRRVTARNIVVNIIFYDYNNDKNTIEELRHKCYRYFPIKEQITFYITNDSGTYWIKGYIESNEINIFSKNESSQISIICPDPYFVKSDEEYTEYITQVVPNFEFPESFESTGELPGYSKYNGSYVIIPHRIPQTIYSELKYFYGNVIVTKVIASNVVNSKGGYTMTIKGSPTPDNPEDIDEDIVLDLYEYDGPVSFSPKKADILIESKGMYFSDTTPDNNIRIEKIPYTVTSNGAGKGDTVIIGGEV